KTGAGSAYFNPAEHRERKRRGEEEDREEREGDGRCWSPKGTQGKVEERRRGGQRGEGGRREVLESQRHTGKGRGEEKRRTERRGRETGGAGVPKDHRESPHSPAFTPFYITIDGEKKEAKKQRGGKERATYQLLLEEPEMFPVFLVAEDINPW
ncbi:unnamed protein product, partial [Pleuronectes platessa]